MNHVGYYDYIPPFVHRFPFFILISLLFHLVSSLDSKRAVEYLLILFSESLEQQLHLWPSHSRRSFGLAAVWAFPEALGPLHSSYPKCASFLGGNPVSCNPTCSHFLVYSLVWLKHML